jgi:hypothetical protein
MWELWRAELADACSGTELPPIKQKVFTAKFPDLPVLEDYSKPAPDKYWRIFPSNYTCPTKTSVNATKIEQLVNTLGCTDRARVSRVLERARCGAEIGCVGEFRRPTRSKNSPDSFKHGPQVSDAVATWIIKGFAYGPVKEEDVPAGAKCSGIMTRVKPDGSVRIILNLSAPKGRSVNDGITAELFPAVMSSTAAWLTVLNTAGHGCWISKCDFADAYKHVAVCEADTDLQWFQWAGRWFKELCLIFGSASSAGIFDDLAKVLLDLVCRGANFPKHMTCQHLDDICAASASLEELSRFDNTFADFAKLVGVKLAPRDSPDKSFAPDKRGTVFGVWYDTEEWTWQIPDDRLVRLIDCIDEAIKKGKLRDKEMQSLAGKLVNIKPLVPAAKFNMDEIMKALAASHSHAEVSISAACGRQLLLWKTLITACAGKLSIPDNISKLPVWSFKAYTDAAGGSLESTGRGTGGVCGADWFYYPWSQPVNSGAAKVEDKKVSRKLSALELVGPLIFMATLPHTFRQQPVKMFVDNAGSVGIWHKGYSNNCSLSNTIVKAIGTVAAGIGCRLDIVKVTRCSDHGPIMADLLSKARFTQFRQYAASASWPLHTDPLRIPGSLLHWLYSPVPDSMLGHRILCDISADCPVLGYNHD